MQLVSICPFCVFLLFRFLLILFGQTKREKKMKSCRRQDLQFNNTLPGLLGTGAVYWIPDYSGKTRRKRLGAVLLDSRFHGKDKGFLFKKNKLLIKIINPH